MAMDGQSERIGKAISLNLCRSSSDFDEIWYADANFDYNDGQSLQSEDGGSSKLFWPILHRHVVRLTKI